MGLKNKSMAYCIFMLTTEIHRRKKNMATIYRLKSVIAEEIYEEAEENVVSNYNYRFSDLNELFSMKERLAMKFHHNQRKRKERQEFKHEKLVFGLAIWKMRSQDLAKENEGQSLLQIEASDRQLQLLEEEESEEKERKIKDQLRYERQGAKRKQFLGTKKSKKSKSKSKKKLLPSKAKRAEKVVNDDEYELDLLRPLRDLGLLITEDSDFMPPSQLGKRKSIFNLVHDGSPVPLKINSAELIRQQAGNITYWDDYNTVISLDCGIVTIPQGLPLVMLDEFDSFEEEDYESIEDVTSESLSSPKWKTEETRSDASPNKKELLAYVTERTEKKTPRSTQEENTRKYLTLTYDADLNSEPNDESS